MADVGRTAYLMHNTEWQATVLTAFWVIDEHLDFNAVGKMVVIGTVPACIYISVPTAIATTRPETKTTGPKLPSTGTSTGTPTQTTRLQNERIWQQ